jgi:hypothetical protein
MKRRTKGDKRNDPERLSRLDRAILQACTGPTDGSPVRTPRLPGVRDGDVVDGLRRLEVFWDREAVFGPVADPPGDLGPLLWPPRREDWVYPLCNPPGSVALRVCSAHTA